MEQLTKDGTEQTKAIEFIAHQLLSRGYDVGQIKEAMHEAAFLATIEAASETLGPLVTPTPLYRISYDRDTSSLDFQFLEGDGPAPKPDAIDIEYADLVFASLQCDRVALLSEGITGTGKTYTLENILKAVYAPDNRRILRLNANMSNVLQPYIEGRVDPNEGVLRININKKAVREIAALFIDEQNRGDTNAIIGLLDNQVTLPTGERADIGLAIPQIEVVGGKIKVHYEDDKVKPVAIHSAQNPSDPQYSGTRRTDGAVGNRQVKVVYPNMALDSGSATLNMTGRHNHQHEAFMAAFIQRFADYLQLDYKKLAELMLPQTTDSEEAGRANLEYLAVHAASFDPENSKNKFLKSAVEGSDHIIALTGGKDLEDNFRRQLEIASQWTGLLSGYGVDFTYSTTIDTRSQTLLRIGEVRAAFSEPLIERDKTKATKIADALALITRYKQAYAASRENGTSTLEEFRALQTPLNMRDIASAYAIVLNDKTQTANRVSPVSVINQAFSDYTGLFETFARKVYAGIEASDPDEFKRRTKFDLDSPDQSIRYMCAYFAVHSVRDEQDVTGDQYAAKMIDALNRTAVLLRELDDGGSDTKKLLIARINADIASLAGFVHQYRGRIAKAFNEVGPRSNEVLPRYEALSDIVSQARSEVKTNYTLPRVQRIFGI